MEAINDIDKNTIVFAVNNTVMLDEANKMGIPVAREGYADREHTADGSLVMTRTSEAAEDRSEERRVGKECRSRWSPEHGKRKGGRVGRRVSWTTEASGLRERGLHDIDDE